MYHICDDGLCIFACIVSCYEAFVQRLAPIKTNKLGCTWVLLGALGYTWVHLGTLGYTRVHSRTLAYTRVHLGTLADTRVHSGTLNSGTFDLGTLDSGTLGYTWVDLGDTGYFGKIRDSEQTNIEVTRQRISGYRGCTEILSDLMNKLERLSKR